MCLEGVALIFHIVMSFAAISAAEKTQEIHSSNSFLIHSMADSTQSALSLIVDSGMKWKRNVHCQDGRRAIKWAFDVRQIRV